MAVSSEATQAEAIQEMLDREAIRDLARRYAHYVWQRNASAVAELFTEDGVMVTPDLPTLTGPEEIVESYEKIFSAMDLYPFVHNHVVDLDGETATGTCYLDLRSRSDEHHIMAAGYYEDRYRRVDGEWLIAGRDLTMVSFFPIRERRSASVTGPDTPQEA
jgi:uncharacterized protein (TIGR02246 family)